MPPVAQRGGASSGVFVPADVLTFGRAALLPRLLWARRTEHWIWLLANHWIGLALNLIGKPRSKTGQGFETPPTSRNGASFGPLREVAEGISGDGAATFDDSDGVGISCGGSPSIL